MKKFTTLLLCILSFCIFFSSCSFQNQPSDSLHLPKEELKLLDLKKGESAIKLYRDRMLFSNETTLAEFIDGALVSYLIYSETDAPYLLVKNDNDISQPLFGIEEGMEELFIRITKSYQSIFEHAPATKDITNLTVSEIYCFYHIYGEGYTTGGYYIFFVTNHGVYVYYKETVSGKNEYLLSWELFFEMRGAVKIEGKDIDGIPRGESAYHEILAPYKLPSGE